MVDDQLMTGPGVAVAQGGREGPLRVAFVEEDVMFTFIGSALSAELAAEKREWIQHFFGPVATDGPGVVAALHRQYGLDQIDIDVDLIEDPSEVAVRVRTADVVVSERTRLDRAFFEGAERLRFVQKFGTNLRMIDLEAAADHGVMVAGWRRLGNTRVGEHIMGMMLALTKQISRGDQAIRTTPSEFEGLEEFWAYNWLGIQGLTGLFGTKLGIVGLGEIGCEIAMMAKAFGMTVGYHQRTRDVEKEDRYGCTYESKDELLSSSDIISVNLPPGPETDRWLGARELGLMKKTAYVVNTSRASVVDEAALVEALSTGTIAGAALDNFWREPVPADHPVLTMENVVLTPHIGGGNMSLEFWFGDVGGVLENIARVARGTLPRGVVNMPDALVEGP
jgi:phosphoglycerate dehydrogenase-like enzyme